MVVRRGMSQLAVWRERITARGLILSLLFLVIAGSIATAVNWLLQPTTLPISAVRVEGNFQHLKPADVQAVLADKASGGFFELDVDRIKQAAETLPWVEQASVRRIWPDTLVVVVAEQVPVARWKNEALLNARGEVFAPGRVQGMEILPLLDGPADSAPEVLGRYRMLTQLLTAQGLQIAQLVLSERRAWEIRLDNGTRIRLGRDQDDIAVQRLLKAYPVALREQMDRIAEVDLRYTNGFAVRWRSIAEKTS